MQPAAISALAKPPQIPGSAPTGQDPVAAAERHTLSVLSHIRRRKGHAAPSQPAYAGLPVSLGETAGLLIALGAELSPSADRGALHKVFSMQRRTPEQRSVHLAALNLREGHTFAEALERLLLPGVALTGARVGIAIDDDRDKFYGTVEFGAADAASAYKINYAQDLAEERPAVVFKPDFFGFGLGERPALRSVLFPTECLAAISSALHPKRYEPVDLDRVA